MKAFIELNSATPEKLGERVLIDVMSIVSVSEDRECTWVDLSSGAGHYVTQTVDYIFEKMEKAFAHLDS
ncbi:hypothetical protein SEA_YECEY3_40 [Mycobacterium phage Yecey3]|uniref:Uncharacterized protein n=1 Tax=Mycobacterium phage Yecey3 TaxID=2656617 RepID=A0A649VA42_9CAUD|nr:hypothetical protein KIV58_gp069 [Mycobacterium phage Yecey3]QGJ88792.1 hypothetical protein SEA_YECEY3_40 [Mycobacterium phage Yecey3]